MKNLLFIFPTIFIFVNFYFWITLGRQKERKLSSKEEIYNVMQDDVYQRNTQNIDVVAGEANIEIYDKLCSITKRKLVDASLESASFIVGPILSTWDSQQEVIRISDQKIKSEYQITGKIKDLHPIFELFLDFPEKVSVYIKKSNSNIENEPHFVLTDSLVYKERLHKPLDENKAVIIENPNRWMHNKYRKKLDEIKASSEVIKLNSEKDVWSNVRFGFFQKRTSAKNNG